MSIRDRILAYCKEQNISRREFARRSGVSSGALQSYLCYNTIPNLFIAKALAKTMGITIDALAEDL